MDEHHPEFVVAWVKQLAQQLGVEVIVTDDLAEYVQVAAQIGVQHQVCHFHLQRWVGKTLCALRDELVAEWHEVLEQVRTWVKEMPSDGWEHLFALYERLPVEPHKRGEETRAMYRLRQLVLRLSENWEKHCLYQRNPPSPA